MSLEGSFTERREPARLPAGRVEREGRPSATQGRDGHAEGLARALGWFSLGLGLAELAAPRRVSRLVGVRERPMVLQALGARGIASGVGVLAGRRTSRWIWARVAGDLVDLALLGAAIGYRRSARRRVAAATAAVAGVAALDFLAARRLTRGSGASRAVWPAGALRVQKTMAVNCTPEEAYAFWRDFENLPRFMEHLKSVQVRADGRSHWVAKAPAGRSVEWDAELVEDRHNEAIAWRSLEGADVENRGTVRFEAAPGGRGAMVHVDLEYRPPAGRIGASLAKLFGEEPEQQIQADLRRFKHMVEAGEVPTTEGQPSGRRSRAGRAMARWRE